MTPEAVIAQLISEARTGLARMDLEYVESVLAAIEYRAGQLTARIRLDDERLMEFQAAGEAEFEMNEGPF